MQDRTPNHAPERPVEPLRELLAAVLEALTLPYDTPDYDRRILDRAATARTVVQGALDEDPADIGWNTDYLRSKLVAEQADAEREAARRSVDRAFPVVAAFLAAERGESPAPSFGPTAVQNVHDDAPTPRAVVRLDYQVSRPELLAALVLGFTETNPDRNPDTLSVVDVRSAVEAALAGSSYTDVWAMVEQLRAGGFSGEQAARLEALERAMERAYPPHAAGGEGR
ncbi:hypothetical protein J7F01_40405 [Streptomyces sp. ISL-22]|uniref:hypothetical protein n=1 Tax=unclassified Streptomyces TaxID=2593676 RepID=UPI001BE8BCB3|nr:MULTISPECIES: hypothetical protein [unclassified Streptomyces]MBT2420589.1 hypothetical protein [Streptomyces sp. ISL-24]MBT2438278.1 hypothetical protein [Streptomyces sp. ISL-22]